MYIVAVLRGKRKKEQKSNGADNPNPQTGTGCQRFL
jgi:hypothetical protein